MAIRHTHKEPVHLQCRHCHFIFRARQERWAKLWEMSHFTAVMILDLATILHHNQKLIIPMTNRHHQLYQKYQFGKYPPTTSHFIDVLRGSFVVPCVKRKIFKNVSIKYTQISTTLITRRQKACHFNFLCA